MTSNRRLTAGDHTISSDIDSLLAKVNMKTAFINLAKNDQELVHDMKQAISQLFGQSKRRELLYAALEHNLHYLSNMAIKSDKERDEALKEVHELRKTTSEMKSKQEVILRKSKQFERDSEQLTLERKRITQLTLDCTKAKEKEDQMAVQLKDAKKALTRNQKKADETKEQFDDLSRKFEFQENEFSELKRQFKELQARYQNADESNKMLLK